jgi:hypothetical protein
MTTKVSDGPGSLNVSSWLAELHMECYKKHLEDYETIKVSWLFLLAEQLGTALHA